MHNNYYLLKQLVNELSTKLIGLDVLEIFSQNKDELILGFASGNSSFYIKAHLLSDFCCLYFPDDFHRSKRNSVNLFERAIGLKVLGVEQYQNERCFSICLQNEMKLLFKMHGNRSNILLCEDNQTTSIFKNKLQQDFDLDISTLNRELDQSRETFEKFDGNYKILFPTFGKPIEEYLISQNYYALPINEKWQMIQDLVKELNSGKFYISKKDDKYELLLMKAHAIEEEYDNTIEALNSFFIKYVRWNELTKEKKRLIGILEKKIRQTGSYINKNSSKLDEIIKGTNHEEIANILMANLHAIPPYSSSAKLTNFYNNQEITIKLNSKLSPQKNAENYYRKAKNKKIEVDTLESLLARKREELLDYEKQLDEIRTIEDLTSLRNYIKDSSKLRNSKKTQEESKLPFHQLSFMGYSIWIGKNAKNNDLLTLKYAKKEDYWLHAKDVSGSHVVIKHQSGKNLPSPVIEKAAQWAAYYSKRKTESLCPVIVTQKKYIRKPKGLPAGAVKVDKEQVVLVEPEQPQFTRPHSS